MIFLVKILGKEEWIDIDTDTTYIPYKEISYEDAQEGLCEKLGKPVLKNLGYPQRLLIAKTNPQKFKHATQIVKYDSEHKKNTWEFTPLEIRELIKIQDKASLKQMAIRICAPREAIEALLNKLGGRAHDGRVEKRERQRTGSRNTSAIRKNTGKGSR